MEMVDSVDDLESSSSTRGIPMPNFEVLDARIASALNKIIHTMPAKMITYRFFFEGLITEFGNNYRNQFFSLGAYF